MVFDFTENGGNAGISTPILIFLVCMAVLILLLILGAVIYVIRKNSYQNATVTRTAIVQIPQQQGVAPSPVYMQGMCINTSSRLLHQIISLYMLYSTEKPISRYNCHERPPVLKDHLTECPTFQYNLTCHQDHLSLRLQFNRQ